MKRLTRVIGAAVLGLCFTIIGGPAVIESALSERNASSTYYSIERTSIRTAVVQNPAAPVVSSPKNAVATQDPVQPKKDEVAAENSKVEEKSGVVPFADFTVDVHVSRTGQLELRGVVTLGATTNGADLLKEHLDLTVGRFSTMIPAGSFKKVAKGQMKGQLKFKKVIDCMYWDVGFQTVGKNKFEFKVELDGETKLSPVKPEQVAITIGDDGGRGKAF